MTSLLEFLEYLETRREDDISDEAAYRLICLYGTDGFNNAISARGWMKYSSWYNERMELSDGSYIIREPFVDGHFIHIQPNR